ncbi:MAG: hypothetical protein ACKV2Q_36535 [Planctomycetaceae bacterium]
MASQLKKTVIGERTILYDADLLKTPHLDVMAGPCRVREIKCGNTAGGAIEHLKLYDSDAPAVGTTGPKFILAVPIGATIAESFPDGIPFDNLSMLACQEAGNTVTNDPSTDFVCTIIATEGV